MTNELSDPRLDQERAERVAYFNRKTNRNTLIIFLATFGGLLLFMHLIASPPKEIFDTGNIIISLIPALLVLLIRFVTAHDLKYRYAKSEQIRDYYGDEEADIFWREDEQQCGRKYLAVLLILEVLSAINNSNRDR